ncbi:MAG: Ig-like domain-containing protein [Pseudonocardiaceae bacterium]
MGHGHFRGLQSGQTLTFNITGNSNAALFSAGPAISAAGVLTYTPAADVNGTATITLTLSDDGGTANGGDDTSGPQTFTITVNAVNDAPAFNAGPNQSVNEDSGAQSVSGWATGISPGPADESGQTVSFSATGNTNPSLFSAGPSVSPTGVLTYTPAADANGTATITLTLSDDGGTAERICKRHGWRLHRRCGLPAAAVAGKAVCRECVGARWT